MATWIHVEAALLCGGLVLGAASLEAAQQQLPIPGVTGMIAPEPVIDQEQAAAHTAIAKTVDGVRHVFTFTKDLLLHGGKGTGVDALQGLREGKTVVVHHTPGGSVAAAKDVADIGEDGLQATEGTVTRIDRGRRQITIRFDNGKSDTFRLTDRAAADVRQDAGPGGADATRVIVNYADDAGHKVNQVFEKTS
jgi:hypothetical protein